MWKNPKKVVFDSIESIIDYFTKGIVPSRKKDVETVISKIHTPDPVTPVTEEKKGKEVVIEETVFKSEIEQEVLEKCLDRIYSNQVQRTNTLLGVAAVVVVGVLVFIGLSSATNNTPSLDYDEYDDYDDIDD